LIFFYFLKKLLVFVDPVKVEMIHLEQQQQAEEDENNIKNKIDKTK